MSHIRLNLFIGLTLAGLLLAACGGGPAPTPDVIGTRVAQDLAVAATLTALAPRPDTPTPTEPPSTTPSPTGVTPTRLAVTILPPFTPTAVPTRTPTRFVLTVPPPIIRPTIPPAVPSAQPTRIQVAVVPVDGSDGNKSLGNNRGVNQGRNILLPGFDPGKVSNPVVFRDQVVFQVEVFDRAYGRTDGTGIESVTFVIHDETGAKVYERTEKTPGYCVFGGGEPNCTVWRFSEHNTQWPGGAELHPGVHDVQILIKPVYSAGVTWFWSFRIEK